MVIEPLVNAIESLQKDGAYDEIIFLTPDGETSFQDNLLAPPVYTRPVEFRTWKIPDILLSGNHAKIEQWRCEQAIQGLQNEGRIYWTRIEKAIIILFAIIFENIWLKNLHLLFFRYFSNKPRWSRG